MNELVAIGAAWFAAGAGLMAGFLAVTVAGAAGFVLISAAVLCALDFFAEARSRLRRRRGAGR